MGDAVITGADHGLTDTPLVTVSFQRDHQRKLKFLEAEPKALGVTQICLIVFHASYVAMFYAQDLNRGALELPSFISCFFVLVAGSVAIAAKNLHLPTVRACFFLEILAAAASIGNFSLILIQMEDTYSCYYYDSENQAKKNCFNAQAAHTHLLGVLLLANITVLAIAVSLIIYACKVINCCSPAPKVPVITIQAPAAAE
ncbi:unnamed protein product [Knipowitschia caucasica]|uniref:Uncharacterized protein n=1 Tax=Knipowitschia caucasica TaxID=637954 RepID=A0AAV2KP48_KNICA